MSNLNQNEQIKSPKARARKTHKRTSKPKTSFRKTKIRARIANTKAKFPKRIQRKI